jgi:putative FmdB family regulatory protein
MPIYEYECQACGERFSALLSLGKRDELEKTLPCPKCEAKGPRRLMSSFSSTVGGGKSSAPACGSGGG